MSIKVLPLVFISLLHITATAASHQSENGGSSPNSVLYIPKVEIVVRQEGERVIFHFLLEDRSGPERRLVPNSRITSISVLNSAYEEIWKIEAPRGGEGASTVIYGVAPKGFVQRAPTGTPAPRLEKSATYFVNAEGWSWGSTSFVYGGR